MAANDWKKTIVATDDRLCKGYFLKNMLQILIFITTGVDFLQQVI